MEEFTRLSQTGVRPKLLCTKNQVGGGADVAFADLERVVNGWTLEFNLHCAIKAFRAGQHEEFCAILNVITAILNRPYIDTDEIGKKLLTIQFLSKFENDATPLESVLKILDQLKAEFSIGEDLFQEVRGAVVEQKLLSAIREKNSSHRDLHLFSYSNLKGKMLLFAESLIGNSEPFLLLSAKTSISRSSEVQDEELRMDCSQEVHQERQASEWNKSSSNPIDKCYVCSNR
ncbi:telomeric repeat-binding factor 2 isoform X2 [Rhincodon typus]|uniref:telomeric repeat-binding factor 2 isoform X2 n=1 Tax=Rhincodon typus TaxID=259920 RepID=UPI00202E70C3|nr:telomeric repeat-binding factor 2 isoform X2 [Rhincodon typus]